jgi:hypothetical protein
MNQLEPITFYEVIGLIVTTVAIMIVIAVPIGFLFWRWGKKQLAKDMKEKQQQEYEKLYGSIQRDIMFYDGTEFKHGRIVLKLAILERLKHKNREMTEVLNQCFDKKVAEFKKPQLNITMDANTKPFDEKIFQAKESVKKLQSN